MYRIVTLLPVALPNKPCHNNEFFFRLRLNCVGIFDVLSFDSNQANPVAVIPHYQVSYDL